MNALINNRFTQMVFKGQFILALCIYFYAALKTLSHDNAPSLNPQFMHTLGNVLLCLSLYVAFYRSLTMKKMVLILIPIALLVEALQGFTPSRVVDISDFTANITGLLIGLGLVWMIKTQRLLRFD